MFKIFKFFFWPYEFFEAYTNWHLANFEYEAISEATFSRRMEERDLRKKRTNVGNVYKDVVIRNTTTNSL